MEVPACIGIILDGNRRWAREKGLPSLEGHRAGLQDTLRQAALDARDLGIRHLAAFMLSTENWSREPAEIAYLLELFRENMQKHAADMGGEGIRIRFAGQRERFGDELQKGMADAERATAHNTQMTLWCCLSYGGRAEIAEAARALAAEGKEITEDSLRARFWSAQMPDPDIIIRTGGEKRLSNFLLWQGAYSELFFLDKLWPDFSKKDLEAVLEEYAARERRMGT